MWQQLSVLTATSGVATRMVESPMTTMLRKAEKQALASLFLLFFGAPLALDRFYESGVTEGILGIIGFIISLVTVIGLVVWLFLVVRKEFVLLRRFVDAND